MSHNARSRSAHNVWSRPHTMSGKGHGFEVGRKAPVRALSHRGNTCVAPPTIDPRSFLTPNRANQRWGAPFPGSLHRYTGKHTRRAVHGQVTVTSWLGPAVCVCDERGNRSRQRDPAAAGAIPSMMLSRSNLYFVAHPHLTPDFTPLIIGAPCVGRNS